MKTMQKNRLALMLVLLLSLRAGAQLSKGTWLTEASLGNMRYTHTSNDLAAEVHYLPSDNRTLGLQLNPRAGYFFTDRLVLGAGLNFQYMHASSTTYFESGPRYNDGSTNISALAIEPFLRYYFGVNDRRAFYFQAGGGYGLQELKARSNYYNLNGQKNGSYASNTNTSYSTGSLLFGYHRFLSSSLAFNSAVGLSYSQSAFQVDYLNGNKPMNYPQQKTLALSWNFGFTLFLSDKEK